MRNILTLSFFIKQYLAVFNKFFNIAATSSLIQLETPDRFPFAFGFCYSKALQLLHHMLPAFIPVKFCSRKRIVKIITRIFC